MRLPFVRLNRARLKLLKVVVWGVVLLNIAYVLFSGSSRYERLHDISRWYDFEKGRSVSWWRKRVLLSDVSPLSSSFKTKLSQKFKEIEDNSDRHWMAHTDLKQTEIELPIMKFLKNNAADSWVNKNELFFDPRFTLSVYINELIRVYGEVKPQDPKSNQREVSLPFNWIDWMDATVLNEDLRKPLAERTSCHIIRQGTNNDPDPAYFCIDNQNFPDERVQELGFKSREQLPGFIIHAHSTHDDRPFNDLRIIESRSYAMTHLPKPFRVVILNGKSNGGTYEFNVDWNSNERVISTNMVYSYLEQHNVDMSKITESTMIKFDPSKEFNRLLESFKPSTLPEDSDVHDMYQTLKKSDASSRELPLDEKLFNYPSSMKEHQIKFYEEVNTVPLEKLSRNEWSYYNGLKECSKYDDSNEPTYFKMATIKIDDTKNRDQEWGWHYDWRFFNGALNYDREGWTEQELVQRTNIILDRLLRNWYRFAEEKGIVTWIMHGPLLSWYWNGLMFPFDVDIDIQMPILELARLAKDYNQTLVVEDPTEGYGKYLIDIGSYIHNRGISEKSNHIDGRFIDVDSGIYIDITGLSKSKANTPEEYNNNPLASIDKQLNDDQVEIYNDRRKHFYKLEQLSPLKYTMLAGVPVFMPSQITDRLTFEYSMGITAYEFRGWYFVSKINMWIKEDQLTPLFDKSLYMEKPQGQENESINRRKLLDLVNNIKDPQLEQLLSNEEILIEYYLTKHLTDIHQREKLLLFDKNGKDNPALDDDPNMKQVYNELVAQFKMGKPLRKALYDYENLERVQRKTQQS